MCDFFSPFHSKLSFPSACMLCDVSLGDGRGELIWIMTSPPPPPSHRRQCHQANQYKEEEEEEKKEKEEDITFLPFFSPFFS